GDTCVTSRSPMTIVPDVGTSSPAMRRSTVLFPPPDGPTRARSSPSAMSSDRSRTADRTVGNILLTLVNVIDATSALYRPARKTGDDAALCNQHQDRNRNRRDDRSRQNLSPRYLVLTTKQRNGDRHGVALGAERERERE